MLLLEDKFPIKKSVACWCFNGFCPSLACCFQSLDLLWISFNVSRALFSREPDWRCLEPSHHSRWRRPSRTKNFGGESAIYFPFKRRWFFCIKANLRLTVRKQIRFSLMTGCFSKSWQGLCPSPTLELNHILNSTRSYCTHFHNMSQMFRIFQNPNKSLITIHIYIYQLWPLTLPCDPDLGAASDLFVARLDPLSILRFMLFALHLQLPQEVTRNRQRIAAQRVRTRRFQAQVFSQLH